jgi:hypothetical protein
MVDLMVWAGFLEKTNKPGEEWAVQQTERKSKRIYVL